MKINELIKELHKIKKYDNLTIYQTDYGNGKSFLIIEWEKE